MSNRPAPSTLINPSPPIGDDTIVVLGAARGGTSMVAGLLRLLNLPMGAQVNSANNEDEAFLTHGGDALIFSDADRRAERERYARGARQIIETRNSEHARWGWKDPMAIRYLSDLTKALRNPRLILISRDPSAVIGRRESDRIAAGRHHSGVTAGRHALVQLRDVLDLYGEGVELVRKKQLPCLLLSYERSLSDPMGLIDAITEFTGLAKPEDETGLQRLVDYVQPNRNSGDIHLATPGVPTHPAPPKRPEAEERLARENGTHATARQALRQAGIALIGDPPHEPVDLANAMNEAMAKDRHGDARALASMLVDTLSIEGPSLGLHPRLLSLQLRSPDCAAPPLFASSALFVLALTDHLDHRNEDAFWRFECVVALSQRYQKWAAPAWATLYHLGLSARSLGFDTVSMQSFARIVKAPLPGHPLDHEVMEREASELKVFSSLAQNQLDLMDQGVSSVD